MNCRLRVKFPTLKRFLQEDEDNIFAGVKKVIMDVRAAWGGGRRTEVETTRVKALKRLNHSDRNKIAQGVNTYILNILQNLNATPNLSVVTDLLKTYQEAEAAAWVFSDLANRLMPDQSKIADATRTFLHKATQDGVIAANREAALYRQVLTLSTSDVDSEVVSMFANQLQLFRRVFALDNNLGIVPYEAARLLSIALSRTDGKENKEQAVLNVVAGLQKIHTACLIMVDGIITAGAKYMPGADDPESPDGEAKPVKPTDVKPTGVKPTGVKPTGVKPTGVTEPSVTPKDNTADIISGLINLGYDAGVAKRLASRVPKDLDVKDAITRIIRGNKQVPKT